MRKLTIVLVPIIVLCSGCVRRTVARSKTIDELGTQRRHGLDADGRILKTKTIWIWDKEYRQR